MKEMHLSARSLTSADNSIELIDGRWLALRCEEDLNDRRKLFCSL